jgi:hypothetical protein
MPTFKRKTQRNSLPPRPREILETYRFAAAIAMKIGSGVTIF